MLDVAQLPLPEYRSRALVRADSPEQADYATVDSIRHKARLCGMNPNYWYPAEWSAKIKNGGHVATRFWSSPIALFRTEDGELGAVEDRCPHRHLPLTLGRVKGCDLVCMYHGWAFNKDGALQSVQHDQFGRELPKARIRSYPVRERYGLIWIFPGDPELADVVPLPVIPNAEGSDRWASIEFDFTWKSHHSMVIDNLCNLTHLYVHGKWAPYDKTWMVHSRLNGAEIELVWKHTLRPSLMKPLHNMFLMRPGQTEVSETHSVYKYPYHVSSQGGARAVNLMLPLSESETRVFTLYYWKTPEIPLLPNSARMALMEKLIVPAIRPSTIEVYRQDGVTVEAEMRSLDRNFFQPTPEVNPAVKLFDTLNSERWQAWLDYVRRPAKKPLEIQLPRVLEGLIAY